MQKTAQSWLVLQLSNSPFMLGLDAFLGEIPIFLFSLVGGVVADRMDRRTLLIGGQIIQMTCAFILAALFALQVVQVWHILCLSFVVGLAQSFGGPAYAALIPTLVKSEDVPNAIAMNSIQFNLARVVGPTLGWLALTRLGAAWCFALNGVSFLAVIASLVALTRRFIPCSTSESMFESMKEGIAFIRRQSGMEALIVLAFCMTALGIPLIIFLPVFAKDVFRQGPNIYTLLLSVSGSGAIVGALLVAVLGYRPHKGLLCLAGLILLGITMSGFALSKSLILSCVLLFVAGGCLIAVLAMLTSLVQLITMDAMRGRVMSVYNVALRGGGPIGSLVAGALVPVFTAPLVVGVAGILMVTLGLFFLLVNRKIASL